MKKLRMLPSLAALALFVAVPPGFAQFSPGPNPIAGTTTTAQALSTGTGTVNAGGAISIASGSAVPLTMTGTSTLVNNGTIQTLGSGRAIDSNSAGSNLTITNTGLISSNTGDVFRVNTNSAVALTNSGTISVTAGMGNAAVNWSAITSAANTLTNQLGGVISSVGVDAIRVGSGTAVINAGSITATPTGVADPSGSDGIDLRTQKTNVVVTNTGTISGRHGIATDGMNVGPSSLTVNNNAGTISALNGSGINVDGVNTSVTVNVTNAFGATIKGGVSAGATNGDGDGVDVDGVLTLNNAGDILGLGARGAGSDTLSNHAEGVSIGGGSITNTATGRIIGSTLAADAPNGDVTHEGHGILVDNSSGGNALAATTITNAGLVQGTTGYAIKIVGIFANSVTNEAGGTIRGAGAGATIQLGAGNDTVVNRGAVIGDNGQAMDLGLGANILKIEGGAAAITGNVSGGTGSTSSLTLDPGAGNTFSYAGAFSNFASAEVKSGAVKLFGSSTYSGATTISGGTLFVRNASGSATGAGAVTVKNNATLAGDGSIGGDVFVEAGGRIAPGDGAGILSITGNLNLVDSSRFLFELGQNTAASDLLAVSGSLNFAGPGAAIFDFTDNGVALGTYQLLTFGSSAGVDLTKFILGAHEGFAGNLVLGSNSLSLEVTAIPEPSTTAVVLGLLAFSGVLGLRAKGRKMAA